MTPRSRWKEWVSAWLRVGKVLERVRKKELRNVNTAEAIASLAWSFEWVRRTTPPRTTSGMVEMQRWFKKIHEKQIKSS